METLAGVSCKHTHSAYARLQKSLHQEWEFVQQVIPGIDDAFGPVEKALRETFVWDMFEGLGEGSPERGVNRLLVDGVLCHHRTPGYSTKVSSEVTDGQPLGLSPGGLDGGLATESTAGGGGTGGYTSKVPGPKRMLTAMGDKDRGLADGAAVHSKRD